MEKALFIGHSYHQKTKSADFFLDIIKTKYDIEKFYFDPYNDGENVFNVLEGKEFSVIVLWQIAPNLNKLTAHVKTKKIVFFPMYDGAGGQPFDFWYSYRNVKIINFSKTLHEKLKNWGFDTHYIQYFPKPADKPIFGNEKQIYFWQRVNQINIKTVEKLFSKIGFDKIHIHKALDPTHEFIEPSEQVKDKIEYSTWYDKKEDMIKDIQKAGIYIAPRHLEGIGMSFLEAMAMGKCVVAPNLPTMNEYIQHNKTGILYNLKNIQALNEFDVKALGKRAHEYIQKGFKNWEKEKFKILDWMEEAVVINNKKLKTINLKVIQYNLFSFLPVLTIKKSNDELGVFLFKIPILTIKKVKKKNSATDNITIDLVYLWCDGSDPEFQKKKNKAKEDFLNMKTDIAKQASNPCRQSNSDELKYSLRSVEKYASWVNHIYIVTDNQVPSWLNTSNPKISIINQSDILPKDALPCFNSNAIEHCLKNIPNLSEYFLHACDDCMINSPVSPEFFFTKERNIIYRYIGQIPADQNNLYVKALRNSAKAIYNKYLKDYYCNNHHNIDAYRKSQMEECYSIFKDEIDGSIRNHFRAESDYHRMIYQNYACAIGKGRFKILKDFDIDLPKIEQLFRKLFKLYHKESLFMLTRNHNYVKQLNKYKPKLFCINDDEITTDDDRAKLKQFLEEYFPKKSEFEK